MIDLDFYTNLPSGELAKAPFRILVLNYYHHTMDMSVANYSSRTKIIIIPQEPKLPIVSENWCGCGETKIVGFNDEGCPILSWHGYEYVTSDKEVIESRTIYLENPYLSHEEVSMSYEYCKLDALDVMSTYRDEVRKYQKARPVVNNEVEDNKEIATKSLWYAIKEKGFVGFYPTYALMMSCKNWASFTITDWDVFAKIMQEAIKAGCFDVQNDYGIGNLVQVLRVNPEEEVYKRVPALKEAVEKMAANGNEVAQMMLDYGVEYIEKISREDSELKHYTLTIEGEKDEWIEKYYCQLFDDEIVAGTTIDLGEYGTATIASIGDDTIDFVWQNKTYHLKEDFYKNILSPIKTQSGEEIDFTVRFYKQNLWTLLKDSISYITFDQVSSIEGKKGCISLKKECALRLVQKLIDKGDKDLEALAYAMKENEEWKCFDFDGELRYLLQ